MRAASGEIWPFHSREGQFVGLGSHPRLSKATGVSDLDEFRLRGPCGSGGSLRQIVWRYRLNESDLCGRKPTLLYVRYSILIILAAWLTTVFSGDELPQDIGASVGPPIEIRIGIDKAGPQQRTLPLALEQTRKALPSMRRSETRRFVILSDLTDGEVAAHGRLLERAAHAVESFRERLGLESEVSWIDQKMLAVAFSRRADFLWFARRHDRLEASWMARVRNVAL